VISRWISWVLKNDVPQSLHPKASAVDGAALASAARPFRP